ncbi:MAG: RNA polymerase factor sigma-54 [Alphaproteobacteria bacterium]|nr:RNA polymerase factor sigma-54 [Alphaproteobacteria bacterium]MBO6627643.1 RNA polymerase factor sigma-54 [Alphaproteobacteria bacterium]
MALNARIELRQGQSLVMTPQLQQAIKLLQLSNLELTDYVEQELERNPLLEQARDDDPPGLIEPKEGETPHKENMDTGSDGDADAPGADTGDGGDMAPLSLSEDVAPPSPDGDLDTDYDNVYADQSISDAQANSETPGMSSSDWQSTRGQGGGGFDGDGEFESQLTRPETLHEHLNEQLSIAIKDPMKRMIGTYLIDLVDETGYLSESIDAVADRLGVAAALVENVLTTLQTFDPVGVCARDLRECLTLQLREKNRLDPVMEKFLAHIDLFAKRDLPKLMKLCEIDQEDLGSLVDDIRSCNPKPGNAFGEEPVQAVVPDIFIRQKTDGSWAVELNTETLPRVLVNKQYYAEVTQVAGKDATAKNYLTECLNDANWLVKSLDQRARTILKVASEIVRQQDAFLVHGVAHLRPLNLKMVADAISMHESTVSRVTSNKYMATPRGIFELKYFFTSSIASATGGDAHSAEAVRHKIKELIDAETPKAVLSDDTLVDMLKADGIDIARRTVAKYREAMNIPSSVQRRREKKVFA